MTYQLAFAYHRPSPTRRRLCDLPLEERPLYRLHRHGSDALATAELLALVLGTAEAPGIADELLTRCGSLHQLARTSKEQLMRIRGIGETQAGRLVAVLELSRRLQAPPADERPRVTSPADAAALLTPRMAHLEQEALWVILLDTRNRVLKMTEIYKGSLNTSVVRTGEIFRPAIEAAAVLPGSVDHVMYLGTDTSYTVQVANGERLVALARNLSGDGSLSLGERVLVRWHGEAAHLLMED